MANAPGSQTTVAERRGLSASDVSAHARGIARDFLGFLRSRFPFAPLDWGIVALVFAGALALDLHRLAGSSLWFDETYSIGLASQPIHVMWRYIWSREPNMQLYYLTLHVWLSLTAKLGVHPTEFIVRLPSAIFAALGSVAVYLLGRRYFGQTTGVVSVTLYSLGYYTLMIAQQTRSYSMQMLFIIIAWYMLLGALSEEGDTRWWWALYTLFTSLALYSQLYSFFVIVAQFAALGALLILPGPWRDRARRAVAPAILSVAATTVLILPLINAARHGSHISWVPNATFKDIHYIFLHDVSSGNPVYMYALLGLIVCGLALALLARMFPRHASPARGFAADDLLAWRLRVASPGMVLLLCWLIVPFGLTYAITQPYLNLHFFFNRYEVVIMPAICLLVGLAIQLLPMRAAQIAVFVALLEIAAVSAPYYYTHNQIQDFRTPITWLQARYQPGDGIVCFPNELCSIPVQAYLKANPSAAHFDSDSPGSYSWVKGYAVPTTLASVEAYAAHHDRVFYVVAKLGGTMSNVSIDTEIRQWLAAHYALTGQVAASSVAVYLYTRRPTSAASATAPAPGKLSASVVGSVASRVVTLSDVFTRWRTIIAPA